MTSVHRPYRTPDELRAGDQVSSTEALTRIVRAVFVVTQPMMAAAAVAARLVLIRQRMIRPRWYVPVAGVILAVALTAGTLRPYLRPWVDLADALRSARSLAGWWPAIQTVVSANWAGWLGAVLPLALAGGLFIGAVEAGRRARRLPVWRDEKPLQVAKDWDKVQRQVYSRTPSPQDASTPLEDVRVHIGLDETTRQPFSLTVRELMYHTYLDGPSGFGKTTTLVQLIAGLLTGPAIRDRMVPVVLVNMKPDSDVTGALRTIAQSAGRKFWHITHDGADGSAYNPLRIGTAHEISGAVMEAEANAEAGGFTEPHYRAAGQRYLQLVSQALTELHARDPQVWPRDYPTLAKTMQVSVMQAECQRLSPELAQRWSAYAAELNADRDLAKSIGGLRQRVARAAESAAGAVLGDGPAGLVLEDAISAGDVVVFDLDAAADTTAAQLVGNLALQDLIRTMARLRRRNWNQEPERFALLAVDEFSALGGTAIADLFQRARSQGAGVLLSTQEAGSLDLAGQGFRETVITNSNVKLLHRQTVNAEQFAEYLGTESYLIETRQLFEERSIVDGHQVYASGQGNIKEGERFVLHPNLLRRLRVGELVIRVGSRASERPALVAVKRWQPNPAAAAPALVDEPTPPVVDELDDAAPGDEVEQEHADLAGSGWDWDDADVDAGSNSPPPLGSS